MKIYENMLSLIKGVNMAEKENNNLTDDQKQTLFKVVSTQAEKGDAKAECMLGEFYLTGLGVEKDTSKAIDWWAKSAEHGNPEAMYNLSIVYYNGTEVEADEDKGFKYLSDAARQSYSPALYTCGRLCEFGLLGEANQLNQTIQFYNLAAEQGHPESILRLGYLYAEGKLVPQDEAKVVELWTEAASKGNTEAQNMLETIKSNPNTLKEFKAREDEYAKSFADLMKLAEAGDNKMQAYVGVAYEKGAGVIRNFKKAKEWYEIACKNGNIDAHHKLACLYVNRRVYQREDVASAIPLWETAAKLGHTKAMMCLGITYILAFKVDKNIDLGKKYLDEAFALKDSEAVDLVNKMNACSTPEQIQDLLESALRELLNNSDSSNVDKSKVSQDQHNSQETDDTSAFDAEVRNLFTLPKKFDIKVYNKNEKAFLERFKELTTKANEGDASAMYELGEIHRIGLFKKLDYKKAKSWFEKADAANYADAKVGLGILYLLGQGVNKDENKALKLLTEAHEKGSKRSSLWLGIHILPEDEVKALDYLNEGIEIYPAETQYLLSIYYSQIGDRANTAKSCIKSIELGYTNAITRYCFITKDKELKLALLYEASMRGDSYADLNIGEYYVMDASDANNNAKVVSWYARACEGKIPEAYLNLASCFYHGICVEADYNRALELYKKAGTSLAEYKIAKIYFDHIKDETQGLKWLKKAASSGDYNAMYELGLAYHEEKYGIKKNYDKAIELWKCASAGNYNAKFRLALHYYYHPEIQDDYRKFLELIVAAAEAGVVEAQVFYGMECEELEYYEDAYRWINTAANNGDKTAIKKVGDFYALGRYVDKDYETAIEYYNKSIELGEVSAITALAELHMKGDYPKADIHTAAKLLKEASDKGHKHAKFLLANLYYLNDKIGKDITKARKLYEEVSDSYHLAAYFLSHMYEYGQGGVQPNTTKMINYLTQAAELGSKDAMIDLAYNYVFGFDVKQDVRVALNWAEKAEKSTYPTLNDDSMSKLHLTLGAAYQDKYYKNDKLSFKYLNLAAEENDPSAYFLLGMMYLSGNSAVSKNGAKAFECFNKTKTICEQLNKLGKLYSNALFALGGCYVEGFGTSKNRSLGMRYIKQSAELGNVKAKAYLNK